jgi:GntR family transcriptional regulator
VLIMSERDWRPLYIQAADDIRAAIARGDWQPGEALPSEPELAAKFGISRTSIRNAIKLLIDQGLVRVEQGKGTFVRERHSVVRRNHTARYQWEKDRALLDKAQRGTSGAVEYDTGLTPDNLAFRAEYDEVPAPDDIADRFGIEPGTTMLRRRYWTFSKAEDRPLTMSTSWLVREVVAPNPELLSRSGEPWDGGTIHQLKTVGIEIDQIRDEVTARPPAPEETSALRLEQGVSVLVLRKTSIDIRGIVVEYAEVIMPGDRTEIVHTTQLARWETPA